MSRPNSAQVARDARETRLRTRSRIEVRQVEIDVRMPRLFHLADDRLAHHVARGQLAARVVVGHEAVAVAIDEPGPFAAHRFGDQAAAAAGDVQHRGMELHELHVAQLGAGAIGQGHAVAGGDFGIGRFAIDLAGAAGAENRLLGPDKRLAVLRRSTRVRRGSAPSCVSRSSVKVFSQICDVRAARCARSMIARMTSLPVASPRAWTMRSMAVAAFAAQGQLARLLVEVACPSRSVRGSARALRGRPSRRPRGSHSLPPAIERVGDVVLEAVFGVEHAGDAALGVAAVRLLARCPW